MRWCIEVTRRSAAGRGGVQGRAGAMPIPMRVAPVERLVPARRPTGAARYTRQRPRSQPSNARLPIRVRRRSREPSRAHEDHRTCRRARCPGACERPQTAGLPARRCESRGGGGPLARGPTPAQKLESRSATLARFFRPRRRMRMPPCWTRSVSTRATRIRGWAGALAKILQAAQDERRRPSGAGSTATVIPPCLTRETPPRISRGAAGARARARARSAEIDHATGAPAAAAPSPRADASTIEGIRALGRLCEPPTRLPAAARTPSRRWQPAGDLATRSGPNRGRADEGGFARRESRFCLQALAAQRAFGRESQGEAPAGAATARRAAERRSQAERDDADRIGAATVGGSKTALLRASMRSGRPRAAREALRPHYLPRAGTWRRVSQDERLFCRQARRRSCRGTDHASRRSGARGGTGREPQQGDRAENRAS